MHRNIRYAAAVAAAALAMHASAPLAQEAKAYKFQSTWPASLTLHDGFRSFAERVDKLSGGRLKIEALSAGQVVPAFEILDATHKKVIDGGHGVAYYWVGKNKAAALFSGPPGGPFGMDHDDFLGWMYEGGGLELYWGFYKELKLNVVAFPAIPPSPQAFGWFKRPIRSLADLKGLKCRQTGLNAEMYQRMGMTTINMPGGEIVPAAQRGVIDCAEIVGGVEDLRAGMHNVWKIHYTPGMHENNSFCEIIINGDVWRELTPTQQEVVRSANNDVILRWKIKWQKQNADAIDELRTKHKVQILRTPPDILVASLKAWDEIAEEESARNPIFKKIYDSQRAYASKVVPAKRFMFPPYSFAANHYWSEKASSKGSKKR